MLVAHVFKLIGLDRQPSQPAARMLDVLVTAEDFLRPQHQGCVYPACLARTAGGNRCRQRAMGQALASGRTTGSRTRWLSRLVDAAALPATGASDPPRAL